jgi:hypothetical protein
MEVNYIYSSSIIHELEMSNKNFFHTASCILLIATKRVPGTLSLGSKAAGA